MQLTVHDAANLLNVSADVIHKWVGAGEIPCHALDDQIRFNRTEILEWATARHMPLAPQLFETAAVPGTTEPTLAETLERGGVHFDVAGSDRAAVIGNLVGLLQLPPDVDRELLCEVLLAREQLSSTGIGDGVAIPHVRNPVVLHGAAPLVMLAFLKEPIDFHAVDGRPVDTLFTLICPTVAIHLRLLSRLVYVLRDEMLHNAIRQRGDAATIIAAVAAAESAIKHL